MSFSASRFLASRRRLVAALVCRILRQRRWMLATAVSLQTAAATVCSPRPSESRRLYAIHTTEDASPRLPTPADDAANDAPHRRGRGCVLPVCPSRPQQHADGADPGAHDACDPLRPHHRSVGPAGLRYEPGACCPEPWRQSPEGVPEGDGAADQGQHHRGRAVRLHKLVRRGGGQPFPERRPDIDAAQGMFVALRDEVDPTIAAISHC